MVGNDGRCKMRTEKGEVIIDIMYYDLPYEATVVYTKTPYLYGADADGWRGERRIDVDYEIKKIEESFGNFRVVETTNDMDEIIYEKLYIMLSC